MTDDELLEKLEESTKNATRHQVETLRLILQHQSGVRYLQPYLTGCDSPVDVDTFKNAVPLSCYDDYTDYINQMADGHFDNDHDHDHDHPLLSVDPLVCFFYSSGTSSMKPKLIPYFDSALSRSSSYVAHQGSAAVLRRLFPPRDEVNKKLWFLYAGNVSTTKRGLKAMAASSYPLHSNGNWFRSLSSPSPREVIFGSNVEHQLYCHLLCALSVRDSIDGMRAAYAIGLVKAFTMLQSKWMQLCDDIETGVLTSEIDDVAMRDSVNKFLDGPRPSFAKTIRLICETKNWEGIVRKLWPNVRYMKCVTTGSMMQYYSKLKYYAGDAGGEVSVVGGDYFASECTIAINLDITQPPETTRYVMLPTAAYFEFLPFDLKESKVVGEETMDFSSVEIGKTYEVIVTTYRGLYRYRLGDIVKVVGFHNSSPEVEFVMRAPKTSYDIVSEKDLMTAMDRFQLVVRNEIVDYTSYMNLETTPKRLKIFIELRDGYTLLEDNISQESLRRSCVSLEDGLGGIYKVVRDKGQVSSLSVSIVKPGTFDKLLQVAVENGAPPSQYKPPKIIRSKNLVDFIEESVLVTVF